MEPRDELKQEIHLAFDGVAFPGAANLVRGNLGVEPGLTAEEFCTATDWRLLPAERIDGAPDGYATALAFFSDEAFQFYLPAYLLADIDGKLSKADPVFHLTFPFEGIAEVSAMSSEWLLQVADIKASGRFRLFSKVQVGAVVKFLKFKKENDPWSIYTEAIDHALRLFWEPCFTISR